MINEIQSFIEENIDIIEQDDWEKVYNRLNSNLVYKVGAFTSVMHACGIHPEYHLRKLPNHFLANSDIQNFTIPNTITSIGYSAFHYCDSLTSKGSKEQWKQIYNKNAFSNTHFIVHCADGDLVKRGIRYAI